MPNGTCLRVGAWTPSAETFGERPRLKFLLPVQDLDFFGFLQNCDEPYPYSTYLQDVFKRCTDNRMWIHRKIAAVLSCRYSRSSVAEVLTK